MKNFRAFLLFLRISPSSMLLNVHAFTIFNKYANPKHSLFFCLGQKSLFCVLRSFFTSSFKFMAELCRY